MKKLALLALAGALIGCGGGGSSAKTSSLKLNSTTSTTVVGRTVTFTAVPTGGIEPVKWTVVGGSVNGSISSDGVYTAPNAAGTYTITVALARDPSVSASKTITVQPLMSLSGTTGKTILPLSKIKLSAVVNAFDNQAVNWAPLDGGSVSSDGTFTAPAAAGTYRVQATSKVSTSTSAIISVPVVSTGKFRMVVNTPSTTNGIVEVNLRTDVAPNTCANIASLANSGYYDGIYFHRYEDLNGAPPTGFIIQGGDPLTKTLSLSDPSIGTGGPGYTINFETTGLLHDQYAVAMARSTGLDTAGSQFYICLDPVPALNGNYCVFGSVTTGQTIASELRRGSRIMSATIIP